MGILRKVFRELWCFKKTAIVIVTPMILSPIIPFHAKMGLPMPMAKSLYLLLLMTVYWCTEVLNIAVTSLLPLIVAPLLRLQTADQVARNYLKDLNALLIGALVMAAVIEHSGLHKRIALAILKRFGTNPRMLLLGFMVPTWFLSMWMNSAATTAMMLAILEAVISKMKEEELNAVELKQIDGSENQAYEVDEKLEVEIQVDPQQEVDSNSLSKSWQKTAKALSLSVAYASTCGGIATLNGSGPNLVLSGFLSSKRKEDSSIPAVEFATWMLYALPISVFMLLATWLWLQIVFIGLRCKNSTPNESKRIKAIIDKEYSSLGRMTWREVWALIFFVALVILWVTKDPGGAGGWANLFNTDKETYVTDATAALLLVLLCFIWPSEKPDYICWRSCDTAEDYKPKPRKPLITWDVAVQKVPWGLILLLGGGFAIADILTTTQLANKIGDSLNFFKAWNEWAIIAFVSTLMAVLTEFTSNTAMATIFIPIMYQIAKDLSRNPLIFLLPATISTSFAFMLPVATAPNTIVFATGVLRISDMAKTGFFLNLIGIGITILATQTYATKVFNIDSNNYMNSTAGSY